MNGFAWALAGFVLIHVGISATGLRGWLVRRIGEGPYRAVFSLLSLVLIVALVRGFGQMRADPFDPLNEGLWLAPDWFYWPGAILAFIGIWLAATGVMTPGPTLAGYEKKGLAAAKPSYGVLRITRHPFLWGLALWAAGHLLLNGERFAVMLFGALGLMVLFGARSIDRKGRARDPDAWQRFEDVTSNAPFAAIAQGRNSLKLGEIGWRGLAGFAITVLLILLHETIVGAPATPS